MRMRKKKHGAERIAKCQDILLNMPSNEEKIGLKTVFSDDITEYALEIGCGKGDFAVGMSAKYPNVGFVAMERISDVCCIALEKAEAVKDQRNDNLRFIIGNAQNLLEIFPAHSFHTIYLNFSDPWPKKGYAKRRLTHQNFLKLYRELLVEGGMLKFKTDNADLFPFSLEQFELEGLKLEWKTEDLHASEKNADNVMTEYERNFSEKGQNIFSAWVKF